MPTYIPTYLWNLLGAYIEREMYRGKIETLIWTSYDDVCSFKIWGLDWRMKSALCKISKLGGQCDQICVATDELCDQIGWSLKNIGDRIYCKSSPKASKLFGLLCKTSLLNKNEYGYFLGIFTPTSGHTADDHWDLVYVGPLNCGPCYRDHIAVLLYSIGVLYWSW